MRTCVRVQTKCTGDHRSVKVRNRGATVHDSQGQVLHGLEPYCVQLPVTLIRYNPYLTPI